MNNGEKERKRTVEREIMSCRRFHLRTWSIVFGLWTIASFIPPLAAQTESIDQAFVSGLRQRRLYLLAETYCRQRLAEQNLGPRQQSDLILQWAQTQVAAASELAIDQQPPAWDSARKTLSDFLNEHPDHPQREVLTVQNALTLLARGQILRQECELNPDRIELRTQAATVVRQAVSELESADRLIADSLPIRQRQPDADRLSIPQLMALQNNIQFQLAQCHLNTALLYGDDQQAARVDALTQVEERLDQLQRRIQPDAPLSWRVLALRMECRRRLGLFSEAEALWPGTDDASLPLDARADLWNERLQLALAQNQTGIAINWLPRVASFYTNSPKLCLSLVQLFLTLAAQTEQTTERDQWQQRAEQTMRVIETRHGPYWSRRANALVLGSVPTPDRSSNRDLALRLANELLRKRRPEEAVQLLDLASDHASAARRPEDALQFAIRAAQIQQERGRSQDAADRFRLAAVAHPEQAEAAAAHLAACWNLAQSVARQPELLAEYVNLLREQLAKWPDDKSADQAAVWLAPLLNRQHQWFEALKTAATVRPTSPDFTKAVELACAAAIAELERKASAETNELSSRAAEIDRILADWLARIQENPTAEIGSAANELKFTRNVIDLVYLYGDPASVGLELESFAAATDQALSWHDAAQAWRALCKAIGGDSIAGGELGELPSAHASIWLGVAEARRSETNRLAIDRLIVDEFAQAGDRWSKLDSAASIRWQIAVAESLWSQGQRDQAGARFESLQQQFPRSLDIQIHFAQVLSRDPNGEQAERAVGLWRAIAAGTKPRSEKWYQAKLELAKLLARQGQTEQAEKLLLYLKTVPPGWDQSPLKPEFEKLLAQIAQGQAPSSDR